MTAKFTVEGIDDVNERLDRLFPLYKKAAGKGLHDWALKVIARAKELCPVDTGNLRSTGYVDDVIEEADRLLVELGFSAEYAAIVHELMDVFHKTGQAKFLESPFLEYIDEMVVFVVAEMEQAEAAG